MYQTSVATAPANESNDLATWGLVAVVVAIFAGIAGYAIGAVTIPSWNDVATDQSTEYRTQVMRGQADGFQKGRRAGSREAKAEAKLLAARGQRASYDEGWQSGYDTGRERALAAQWGEPIPWSGTMSSGTYPEFGTEDLFLSGDSVFDDVPGYSSSSYSTAPYGTGASTSGGYTDWYRGGTSPAGY
jgi:hypothetical protein